MGELKNLTSAKHFFHSTEKNGMTNDKNYIRLHFVFLTADAASLNKHAD